MMASSYSITDGGIVAVYGNELIVVGYPPGPDKVLRVSHPMPHPFVIKSSDIHFAKRDGEKPGIVACVLTTEGLLYLFYSGLEPEKPRAFPISFIPHYPYVPLFTNKKGFSLIASGVSAIYNSKDSLLSYTFLDRPGIYVLQISVEGVSYVSSDDISSTCIYSGNYRAIRELPYGLFLCTEDHPSGKGVQYRVIDKYRTFVIPDPEMEIDPESIVSPILVRRRISVYKKTDGNFYLYDPHLFPLDERNLCEEQRALEATRKLEGVVRVWSSEDAMALHYTDGSTRLFYEDISVMASGIRRVYSSVDGSEFLVDREGESSKVIGGILVVNMSLGDHFSVPHSAKSFDILYGRSGNTLTYGRKRKPVLSDLRDSDVVYTGTVAILFRDDVIYYLDKKTWKPLSGTLSPGSGSYMIDAKPTYKGNSTCNLSLRKKDDPYDYLRSRGTFGPSSTNNNLLRLDWRIVKKGEPCATGKGVSREVNSRIMEHIRTAHLVGNRFTHWSSKLKEMDEEDLFSFGMVLRMVCSTSSVPRLPLGFLAALVSEDWTDMRGSVPTKEDYRYFLSVRNPEEYEWFMAVIDTPDSLSASGFENEQEALECLCEMDEEYRNASITKVIAEGFLSLGSKFLPKSNLGSLDMFFSEKEYSDPEIPIDFSVSVSDKLDAASVQDGIVALTTSISSLDPGAKKVLLRNWVGEPYLSKNMCLVVKPEKEGRPYFSFKTCLDILTVTSAALNDVESLVMELCRPEYELLAD